MQSILISLYLLNYDATANERQRIKYTCGVDKPCRVTAGFTMKDALSQLCRRSAESGPAWCSQSIDLHLFITVQSIESTADIDGPTSSAAADVVPLRSCTVPTDSPIRSLPNGCTISFLMTLRWRILPYKLVLMSVGRLYVR